MTQLTLQYLLSASQRIANETEAVSLTGTVLKVIHEQIPADRLVLISKKNGSWCVIGELTDRQNIRSGISESIKKPSPLLPLSVFSKALHSNRTVSDNHIEISAAEPYFEIATPEALMCHPVGDLVGTTDLFVYAEYTTTSDGFFSEEDEKFIDLLSPQIATSFRIAAEFAKADTEIDNRDAEINKQVERVNQVYGNVQLLGEIGQSITTNRTVEKIIDSVYTNVNTLMDASLFSIGLFNSANNTIDMPSTIERGRKLSTHSYSLEDAGRLAVWCFRNLKEVIINNIETDYNRYFPESSIPKPKVGESPLSVIYLPILANNKPIGVLTVQSFEQNVYTNFHINILRNLAIYVAIALENAASYQEIGHKNEEIATQKAVIEESNKAINLQKEEVMRAYQNVKLLGEIGRTITSSLSVERIVDTVYTEVNKLMDASVFWIGTHNEQRNVIEFKGAKEKGKKLPPFHIDLKEKERIAVWCYNRETEVFINDFETEYSRYVSNLGKPVAGDQPSSVIYLPIFSKEKTIGVLTVQSFSKNAYNENHLNLLKNMAIYIGIALDNAVLYENLEDKVKERTFEVVKQKEEIEEQHKRIQKAYKNIELLSGIGREITLTLSLEEVVERVYESVNKLMDAAAFGIGIYHAEQAHIEFIGAMETGQKLPVFYHKMQDEKRYSVWSLKHRAEVVINDHEQEYAKYIPEKKPPAVGKEPESLIYLPLIISDRPVGVITVQSFLKNAYSEYHLNMLKSLAVYVAIALENAEAYRQIHFQKEEIQKSSQKMRASINYGKRIQRAILPKPSQIRESFSDAFILFKPRDIVSGDFYWFLERDGKKFLAAVDCTGHGVPGAFMSMIANELLNEIVGLLKIDEPDEILNELHIAVRKELKQLETGNRDGMDLTMCVVDEKAGTISYAGAKNPLVYVKNHRIYKINGDKLPVGGVRKSNQRRFTKHVLLTDDVDCFYLFSDGYQDQFGGPDNRKFMSKRFRELLFKISDLGMPEQKSALTEALMSWQGYRRQTDDILVLGVRV